MKLNWPIREYTHEEIMAAHGDERMRRLLANDFNTMSNIFLILAFATIIACLLIIAK